MSVREQDFYKLLGIERNATFDEIKHAYRSKALSAHSDRTGSCDDELMKQLNIAYEKLSDLSSREDYDESLDLFHEEGERRAEEVAGYIATDQFSFSKQYRQRFIELSAKYLHDTAACIPYSRCYKPFISNLYTTREGPAPTFIHDIFSFIKLKEAGRYPAQVRANWSQPLDLKRAIELFTAFLQGDYFGNDLEKLGDYFKAEIIKLKVQVGEQDKSYLLLYKAMFNIINLTHEEPVSINVLLKSTAALTRAAVNIYLRTRDSSNLTLLFANKYFRNFCAYTLHLSWTTTDIAVIDAELLVFNNVEIAKEALQKLKDEYKQHREQPDYRKILIRQARSVRLLCRFAEDIDEKLNGRGEKLEAEFYREIAFHLLDWLPSLFEIPSKKMVANVLLQIGLYFKKASLSPGAKNIKMADEELALSMFFTAINISERAGADVELHVKSFVLKYFNIFEFGNEVSKKIIPLLQNKILYLANIFPFLPTVKPNIDLILHDHEHLWFLRNFLHHLVAIVKARGADSSSDIDHEYVAVLYQAYEACLRHWYMEEHEENVVKAREIKLELMQRLLAKNGWTIDDLRKNVDSPWVMVDRDDDGWLVPRRSIPLPVDARIDKFKSLDSIIIDKKIGNIEFIFNPQTEQDPEALAVLTVYDLLEMMEKNIKQAFFSLDPVDANMHYHPFNTMRFAPSNIYQTQFLNTLLITDYLLKFFTVNREVQARDKFATRSLDDLTKTLPKFLKDIIHEFQTGHNEEEMHRFWIEAEETPAILSEEDSMLKLHVGEVRMVVKKHALRFDADGKLVDKDEDDEGWSVYVYPNTGGTIYLSQKEITSPAIICIKGENKIYFYERGVVSPATVNPGVEQEKLEEIWELARDKTDKVLLGSMGSKVSCHVYSFVRNCTERASKLHYYSKEYVFAQEFTMNYDLFALHFAEFGRLKELSKVTALIKLLNVVVASNKQTVSELEEKLRKADNDPFWKETTAEIKKRFIEVNLSQIKQNLQRFIDNNPKIFSKSWFSWFESKESERAKHCAVHEAFADVQKEAEQAGLADLEFWSAMSELINECKIEPMAEIIVATKVPQAVVDYRKEMREAVLSLQKLNQELARLGIKDEEPKEVDLTGKCLWVPANINHNEKESRVVYGGVLVQPAINFLQRGTPQYTSLAASTYSGRHSALDRTYLDRARQESVSVQGGRSTVQLPTYLFGQEVARRRAQATAASAATRTPPTPAPAAARSTTFTPVPAPAAKPATVVRPTTAPAPAPAPVRPTVASAAAGGASRRGPPPAAAAEAGAGAQGGARGTMGGGAAGSGGGRGPGNGGGGYVGVARPRSPDAPSAADAVRLRTVLALKENGILDAGGKLTQQAIDRAFLALPDDAILGNPSVITELTKDGSKITDWRKMTTESTDLAIGQRIQVHFYQNRVTGEVNYTHQDFKVKNPVAAFDVMPSEEASRKGYRPTPVHDVLARYK